MRTDTNSQAARASPESGPDSVTVKVLRSAEEIERIREFWNSCPGARDSDIDVFLPKHPSTHQALRPCVLVLYRGGRPSSLLAGRIIHQRFGFRIGWFDLFKPPLDVLTIPQGGLHGDASSDACKELVREIIRCLRNGDADIAYFRHLDAESALFRAVKSEPGFLFRDHFRSLRPHRKRKLPGGVEQLYKDLSANERQRFRRIARALSREFSGQVRVDRFGDVRDLDAALSVVEGIANKTWQQAMGSGFALSELVLNVLRAEAERGWLRVYILYLGGQACAFWIGALYQRTFYSDYLGYDPDFSKHSPGMYLLSQIMEEFCSEGVGAIDFGSVEEEYKKRFGNVMWLQSDRHIFAPTLKGLIFSGMNSIAVLLHEPARAFLERTGLTQRVKRIWREVRRRRKRTDVVQSAQTD
jgi:Acetyltransferase (GNAT) domain